MIRKDVITVGTLIKKTHLEGYAIISIYSMNLHNKSGWETLSLVFVILKKAQKVKFKFSITFTTTLTVFTTTLTVCKKSKLKKANDPSITRGDLYSRCDLTSRFKINKTGLKPVSRTEFVKHCNNEIL